MVSEISKIKVGEKFYFDHDWLLEKLVVIAGDGTVVRVEPGERTDD